MLRRIKKREERIFKSLPVKRKRAGEGRWGGDLWARVGARCWGARVHLPGPWGGPGGWPLGAWGCSSSWGPPSSAALSPMLQPPAGSDALLPTAAQTSCTEAFAQEVHLCALCFSSFSCTPSLKRHWINCKPTESLFWSPPSSHFKFTEGLRI